MNAFPLKIVTPDGLRFDGQAQELVVRTATGDMGICAGHIPCVAPLGMGQAMVIIDGQRRYGACIGGMVAVAGGQVRIVATSFEWAGDIDVARAEHSEQRAREVLQQKNVPAGDVLLAQARLKRALIRKSVAQRK